MMTILVSCIICYTITEFIVNGSILDFLKKYLINIISKNESTVYKMFVCNMLHKILTCTICAGFWIGLSFSLLTYIIPINIFGMSLILLSGNYILGSILLGCFFSGTSWIISTVLTYMGNGQTPSTVVHNFHHED